MKNLYVLTYEIQYGWKDNFYFICEKEISQYEFEMLCNELLDEVVEKLLEASYNGPEEKSVISWQRIIRKLAEILPEHGFEQLERQQVTYEKVEGGYDGYTILGSEDDPNTLLSSESLTKVTDFNKSLLKEEKEKRTTKEK